MVEISNMELIERAQKIAVYHESPHEVKIGEVGSVLVTDKGKLYEGVSIHACCGIGFCAEHSAVAAMVTKQEYVVKKIVAVSGDGRVMPPCGRCREMLYEIDPANMEAEVIVEKNKVVKLRDLLPDPWQKRFGD